MSIDKVVDETHVIDEAASRSLARITFDAARRGDQRTDPPPALHLLNLSAAWAARERRLMAEEMYRWQAPALIRGSHKRRLAGLRAHTQGELWAAEYGAATHTGGPA